MHSSADFTDGSYNQGTETGSPPRLSQDHASIHTEKTSGVISLTGRITRTITDIREAVQDDNRQLADATTTTTIGNGNDSILDEYNRLLVSRFDVGDAISMLSSEDGEGESVRGVLAKPERELDSKLEYTVEDEEGASSLSTTSRTHTSQIPLKTEKGTEGIEVSVEVPIENRERKWTTSNNLLGRVFGDKTTRRIELPPDKGYAWIACFSCWLIMFNTWGCNAAFGVFLAFFFNKDVFPGTTNYDYSLVAGLTPAIGNVLAPVAMISIRLIGVRPTMTIGTVFLCLGFVLASYAKSFWQLAMTQGVMIGIAMGLAAAPPLAILPGWFLKWRAVAVGASLFGTGAGGVAYALASNRMIQHYGNTNMCFRMLAIICTICCALCVVLSQPRKSLHPKGVRSWKVVKAEVSKMFSLGVMKQFKVQLIALWFTISVFGYNLMIFTLSPYAVARGMTQHQGSALTAIMNGAQSIGRPLMGLAGDRWGRSNITVILTGFMVICMFGFWIPAHSFVQLIFFSILVGSSVGVANVMNNVLVADLVRPDEFLAAWSYVNSVGSPLILCCELIAQALTDKSHPTNPYFHTQIFAGFCFLAALILTLIIREIAVRDRLTLRQEETLTKIRQKSSYGETSPTSSENDDTCSTKESWELLKKRRDRYEMLLGGGMRGYFMRMFYPIRA